MNASAALLRRLTATLLVLAAASCWDAFPGDEEGPARPDERLERYRCDNHIAIEVTNDGHYRVEGKELSLAELRALLRARTEAAPHDEDELPLVSVELRARAECEYSHLQRAMAQCLREKIWRLHFGLVGKEELQPPRPHNVKAMKEMFKKLRDAESGGADAPE